MLSVANNLTCADVPSLVQRTILPKALAAQGSHLDNFNTAAPYVKQLVVVARTS